MESSAHIVSAPKVDTKAITALPIPWFALAALFGSTSMIIGGQWDISWHMTIGRDSFWTPAHMAIYLGGVVAGLSSGYVVLKTTFWPSAAQKVSGVRIWGFTGPLGAFFCIWGAFAMLASAPFDDWWHNTYGLDTEILSPPHVLLSLGIGAIQVGAMIVAVALQNRADDDSRALSLEHTARTRWLKVAYSYGAGMLMTSAAVMCWTYMARIFMHSSIYYQVGCGVIPFFLVAAARASRLKWPATTTAAIYMGFCLALMWILPLFPGEPRLGPVRQHVTHLVPLEFPIVLIVPAFVIDIMMRRIGTGRDWGLPVVIGLAFFISLLAVQWPFGDFLMSPYSRNWVFATHRFSYFISNDSYQYRHEFYTWDANTGALIKGLLFAIPLAVVSSRVGLVWGNWMRKVQR